MRSSRSVAWACAMAAGGSAAMAAVFAKLASPQMRWELRLGCYGSVVACNVAMWTLYVQSLASLSSLQATVLNFASNFLLSGLAGFLIFSETAQLQWFMGAFLIVLGIMVLSKADNSLEASASPTAKED